MSLLPTIKFKTYRLWFGLQCHRNSFSFIITSGVLNGAHYCVVLRQMQFLQISTTTTTTITVAITTFSFSFSCTVYLNILTVRVLSLSLPFWGSQCWALQTVALNVRTVSKIKFLLMVLITLKCRNIFL